MKLAVFGVNGPTGRLLTQLALDEHHEVVAFTRHLRPSRASIDGCRSPAVMFMTPPQWPQRSTGSTP